MCNTHINTSQRHVDSLSGERDLLWKKPIPGERSWKKIGLASVAVMGAMAIANEAPKNDPSKKPPTQATFSRPDGIVAVDYNKCIGCRYCIAACPYGARSFDFGHNYIADKDMHCSPECPCSGYTGYLFDSEMD